MTIPFTVAGFVGGIMYFGNLDVDPTKPIFVRYPPISIVCVRTHRPNRTWTP